MPAFERATHKDLTGHEDELAQALSLQMSYSVPELKIYLANRTGFNGEIKAYSDPVTQGGKDVAIVKIDANHLPTVPLGDSDKVHIQEAMRVIGYPGSASPLNLKLIGVESLFVPTVTNGHVSAVKVDFKGNPVIQSDAAITHGNSGGPAFNDAGEVIGIATFGPEVAGFNFFVPINTAMEFVNSVGAKPASGLFDRLWQEALDTYDAGKFETSKRKLDDVLRIMPNEPDAMRLFAAAEAGAVQEGVVGRALEDAGWMIWVLAGLVVVAVVSVDVPDEGIPLHPGDILLVCTDGLHGLVSDAELLDAAVRCEPREACAELVRLARTRGGPDNITVQIARLDGALQEAPAARLKKTRPEYPVA